MEELLQEFIVQLPGIALALLIAVCLLALGKGADWLVDEAVALSRRSGIPKIIIGATIVSLGTTTPEAVVSVLAAVQGRPGLALGNAVGSIICDTGLILGTAILIAPLTLDRRIVNRQGWIQLASGFLLVGACIPWSTLGSVLETGGRLNRSIGFLFLILLAGYLVLTIRWAKRDGKGGLSESPELEDHEAGVSTWMVLTKLLAAIGLVIVSSWFLIPAVGEAAGRMGVPEAIIAATLVAFGTSLPELVTAVTAARQGHGELAVGNVVGADILNVLFVAGAASAATPGGLQAPPPFFFLYFPSMLLILIVFRIGIIFSGTHMRRPFGVLLLGTYLAVTLLSYVWR